MPFRFDFFVQRMKHRQAADKPRLTLVEKRKDRIGGLDRKLDARGDSDHGASSPRRLRSA